MKKRGKTNKVLRRRATEVIENAIDSTKEAAFIQIPGHEPYEVSKIREEGRVSSDKEKILKYLKEKNAEGKKYRQIHTHPQGYSFDIFDVIDKRRQETNPSFIDIYSFLVNPHEKSSFIAQKDTLFGNVSGYIAMIHKKKLSKNAIRNQKLLVDYAKIKKETFADYLKGLGKNYDSLSPKSLNKIKLQYNDRYKGTESRVEGLEREYKNLYKSGYSEEMSRFIAENYGIKIKFKSVPPKMFRGLEEKVAADTAILFLLLSLLFLSTNITGNVIGISRITSNWIGGILFILGILGAFFYFKKRN